MIHRRSFLASSAGAAAALAQQHDRPPNVLFILFDKCRTDAIGAYGERKVHTPNIDALAREGVLFNRCYTPQALCGPARASILTGLYPHAHGLRRNVYPMPSGKVNSNYPEPVSDPFRDPRFRIWDNFVFLLNNAGFATGHIGKWHLGPGNPGFFDYFKSFNSLLRHWIGEPHRSRYRPDVHTDQGIQFIEQHAHEPFFLYQSYYAPHEPNDPPKQFYEHHQGAEHADYYASVTNLDWNVGRLVDTLRRRNLLDDTLIILSTEHGRTWIDRPASAEQICLPYEEVSRIPLIMRYPKMLPKGKRWQSGVSLVDVMPTILEAANVSNQLGPPQSGLRVNQHGRSLITSIREGKDVWDRPMVVANIPQKGIDGSYFDERSIRTEQHRLILRKFDVRPEMRPGELYDLKADPGEARNLYSSQPALVKQLARRLADWGRDYRDDLSMELGNWASA
jgi:arylsulfatase A-like enzyme